MLKHERNIRYKLGSGDPYVLSIWRDKRSSWKRLRDRPTDLKQAKARADAIATRSKSRPVLVKVTDPTNKVVVYLVALAGRPVMRQRSVFR